ncbi:cytochrome P450 [Meredithblackwellia eburnea MCA 4105]
MISRFLTAAAVAAFTTHRLIYKHEPDALLFIFAWLVGYWLLNLTLLLLHQPLREAIRSSFLFAVSYCATLASSILVRRIFIHPLRHFPGPFGARISRFWNVLLVAGLLPQDREMRLNGTSHEISETRRVAARIKGWHQKWGSFVRTGPCELSVADVDAIPVVLGAEGRLNRGRWYIFISRSVTDHIRLRKLWDTALAPNRAHNHHSITRKHAQALVKALTSQLESVPRRPFNLHQWIQWTVLDIAGSLAFNSNFSHLDSRSVSPLRGTSSTYTSLSQNVHESMRIINTIAQVPWTRPMWTLLFEFPKPISDSMDMAEKAVRDRRRRNGSSDGGIQSVAKDAWSEKETGEVTSSQSSEDGVEDLLDSLLLYRSKAVGESKSKNQITAAQFLVLLGMESVATVVSTALFEVLSHRPYLERLRNELLAFFPVPSRLDQADSRDILETLRLNPPFPCAMPRTVGREGAWICGRYVPGGTLVGIPTLTLHHSSRYFSPSPASFLPERWLSDSPVFRDTFNEEPFVHDTRAFIPFGVGAFECPARELVFDACRLLIAILVLSFDIELSGTHRSSGSAPSSLSSRGDNFLGLVVPFEYSGPK